MDTQPRVEIAHKSSKYAQNPEFASSSWTRLRASDMKKIMKIAEERVHAPSLYKIFYNSLRIAYPSLDDAAVIEQLRVITLGYCRLNPSETMISLVAALNEALGCPFTSLDVILSYFDGIRAVQVQEDYEILCLDQTFDRVGVSTKLNQTTLNWMCSFLDPSSVRRNMVLFRLVSLLWEHGFGASVFPRFDACFAEEAMNYDFYTDRNAIIPVHKALLVECVNHSHHCLLQTNAYDEDTLTAIHAFMHSRFCQYDE
jgi:hypothetical protein